MQDKVAGGAGFAGPNAKVPRAQGKKNQPLLASQHFSTLHFAYTFGGPKSGLKAPKSVSPCLSRSWCRGLTCLLHRR